MATCLLGIGSNLGDPRSTLAEAAAHLRSETDLRLLSVSQPHETRPIGGPAGQSPFMNAAATIETNLPPQPLIERLLAIEARCGRERRVRWAARTLDIDLLLYDDAVTDLPELQVPHPRMSFRPFVLAPAVEVAASLVHPLLRRSLADLWRQLNHGASVVSLVGENEYEGDRVAALIAQHRPGLAVQSGESPGANARLTICLSAPCPLPGAGPTLWLPTGLTEGVLQQEVLAALECVWPGLG